MNGPPCGSDNAALPAAGAQVGVRGEAWLAEEQTAGKGRAGHGWESRPKDGIYLSALLRPRLAPAEVIIFSLAAGLAVVEAVHEVTGLWSDLRWPNDVMLGGRKFCGILTELNAEVTRVRYVVVGMGLNVNNEEFPPELASVATSLRRETGHKVSRVELVAALLRALDREQAALADGAAGSREAARERILRRFEQHSSYCCGAAVTVEEDGGYAGVTLRTGRAGIPAGGDLGRSAHGAERGRAEAVAKRIGGNARASRIGQSSRRARAACDFEIRRTKADNLGGGRRTPLLQDSRCFPFLERTPDTCSKEC